MKYFDYAHWAYEQLIMQQPHVKYDGLWRLGDENYILCPEVKDAKTVDGKSLYSWFDKELRPATTAVKIVSVCPAGAERVPEQSAQDRADLKGFPRSLPRFSTDLLLLLSSNLPPFAIGQDHPNIAFITQKPLTAEEKEEILDAYRSLGDFPELKFKVDSEWNPEKKPPRNPKNVNDNIDLIPSRRLAKECGNALRRLVEEDDTFWTEKKKEILATPKVDSESLLPQDWNVTKRLGCLVDATVSNVENIRTYLSLYEIVYLSLPLDNRFEEISHSLGVNQNELKSLVELGRVKLLVSQSINRHPIPFLNEVAETAPANILLSRRLAAATVVDARRRIPLLYPPLSPLDRYFLLHFLADHVSEWFDSSRRDDVLRFIAEMGRAWSGAEWSVHSRGAMGTSNLGIGRIAGALYEARTKKDLRLELWWAAQKIEWAGALRAHAFPTRTEGYDETGACEMVAGLYNPAISKQATVMPREMLSTITGLLAVDNSVPVVDFAREFSSADIRRLREVVLKLTRENVDPDFLKSAIDAFNAEVRHYERRPELLSKLNLVGLFSAGLAADLVSPEIKKLVSLAGHLCGFILNRFLEEVPRMNGVAGVTIDTINSLLTGRLRPDAVLVARARKEVSLLKR